MYPPIPFFFAFPSLLPFLSLPNPVSKRLPLITARRSWERCQLPHWFGRNPSSKRSLLDFESKPAHVPTLQIHAISRFDFVILDSVLSVKFNRIGSRTRQHFRGIPGGVGIFYQSLKPNGKLNPVTAVRRMHRKSNGSNNFQKEAGKSLYKCVTKDAQPGDCSPLSSWIILSRRPLLTSPVSKVQLTSSSNLKREQTNKRQFQHCRDYFRTATDTG